MGTRACENRFKTHDATAPSPDTILLAAFSTTNRIIVFVSTKKYIKQTKSRQKWKYSVYDNYTCTHVHTASRFNPSMQFSPKLLYQTHFLLSREGSNLFLIGDQQSCKQSILFISTLSSSNLPYLFDFLSVSIEKQRSSISTLSALNLPSLFDFFSVTIVNLRGVNK